MAAGGQPVSERLIRHTHPDGFRSGQWAAIRAVVPGDDRECYLVEFPDGVTDFWSVEGLPMSPTSSRRSTRERRRVGAQE